MPVTAVRLNDVSKFYKLYDSPKDRLKEALLPFGRKLHREFYALKNIDLEVKKGEILGIVGRNGSGKSTLLKIISGVIQPNSGTAVVRGEVSSLLELGAGLNPDFDGIQNIYFGGLMLGLSRDEIKSKIDDIIAFADIGEFINQPIKTYSSGMKARLGFALAISIKPDILVVDEVLAVGDDLFKKKCFNKMEELFNAGCTVFFVSHSNPHVNELCTRAVLLDKGEIILEGPTPFVTRYYQKLLYTLPGTHDETRNEILQLNSNQDEKDRYKNRISPDTNEGENDKEKQLPAPEGIKENQEEQIAYFIPGFTPKTTVEHEFYDVKISDIQIRTPSGKVVNALVMDEDYILSYKVLINLDMEKIKVATLILNEKGLAISGHSIHTEESCTVNTGDIYYVQIRFTCTLLPGTYFIGISVNKVDKNSEKYRLYEVHDATAFQVQKEKNMNQWGIVKLGQTGQIEKLSEFNA